MKPKVLIFDLDDTIIDIKGRTIEKLNKAAETLKVSLDISKIVSELENYGDYNKMDVILEQLHPEVEQGPLWRFFQEYGKQMKYKSHVDNSCFDKFIKRGFKLGIITNGNGSLTYKKISDSNLNKDKFEFILHQGTSGGFKPNPVVFKQAKTNYPDHDLIYVGDGYEDFLATKLAGIKYIALTSGLTNKSFFEILGQDPNDILDNLSKIDKHTHLS